MQDTLAMRKLFFSLAAVYLVILGFTGMWPWLANPYNAYALQAQAWLQGRLDLSLNYTHLNLAVFQGKYFVAYPPFPSMLFLPFVLIAGPAHSPDHLIALVAGFVSAWFAFKIARLTIRDSAESVFWALFVTVGGNFLLVSFCGWDVFMAQTLSFALCLGALYFALTPRFRDGFFAFGLWALAVGCRPIQIIYLPVFIWLVLAKLPNGLQRKAKGLLWFLVPLVVCAGFAWLNYARFGNIAEFGSSYLPDGTAQFSLTYLGNNLVHLLALPNFSEGRFQFSAFNGFAFYLASPLVLAFMIQAGIRFWRKQTLQAMAQILVPILILAHLVIIACQKDLGGWQFGNRYTIDFLPFLFLGLLMLRPDHFIAGRVKPIHHGLFFLGFTLNLVGGIALFNHWI